MSFARSEADQHGHASTVGRRRRRTGVLSRGARLAGARSASRWKATSSSFSAATRAAVAARRPRNIAFRRRSPAGGWAAISAASSIAAPSASSAAAVRASSPQRLRLLHPDHAAGEDELLGLGEPDQRRQASRADGHSEPRAGPGQHEVVAADAQVAAGRELGPRADDVAHADADDRRREGLEVRVQPGEGLHPRDAALAVELLAATSAPAQKARELVVERTTTRSSGSAAARASASRSAPIVAVSSALRTSGRSSRRTSIPASRRSRASRMVVRGCVHDGATTMTAMRRLPAALLTAFVLLLLAAPFALAAQDASR